MSDGDGIPEPTTFREAEVIGLRFMQEGRHEDALTAFKMAMKLPGSRPDVVRTKMLSGPSPVGGSQGGTEGKLVMGLDEFELQAAHYNMACAYSRLGNISEVSHCDSVCQQVLVITFHHMMADIAIGISHIHFYQTPLAVRGKSQECI